MPAHRSIRRKPVPRKSRPLQKVDYRGIIAEAIGQRKKAPIPGRGEFKKELGKSGLEQLASAAELKGVNPKQLRAEILLCNSIEEVFKWLSELKIKL